MFKDPYRVLGVNPSMGIDEIQKAYRKLAKVYHPDKPDGDAEKFKELKEAWETIKSRKDAVGIVKRKKSFVTHKSLFKFRRI